MTRAFDFTVVSIVYIVAVIVHLMAIEMMAPGTPLYALGTTGTEVMNGQQWADRTFMILSTWVPMIGFAGITAWAVVREYKRQALTAVTRVSP